MTLDGAEQEALDLLFERAGSNVGEVEGFAFSVRSAGLSSTALRLGTSIGGLGLSARPNA